MIRHSLIPVRAIPVVLLLGCGTAVQSSGGLVPRTTIEPRAKVLVLPFADAIDKGGSTIGGSGGAVTAAIRDALVAHSFAPVVGDSKTLADGFGEAEKLHLGYVLKGTLVNWEDNATEWSGRPDTAGLSVEIYTVSSRSLAGSATENIRASALSFTPGTPDRFVPQLVDTALGRIFKWPSAPIK